MVDASRKEGEKREQNWESRIEKEKGGIYLDGRDSQDDQDLKVRYGTFWQRFRILI